MYQSHLVLAHQYWKELLQENDIVIDTTCGNGHDTKYLVSLKPKLIFAMDIQAEAIESTKGRLSDEEMRSVEFVQGCHSRFPEKIAETSVKLIVYNLGYLPGGEKSKTTMDATTLESLENAQKLVMVGGGISVTCYPGHAAGKIEEKAVLEWAEKLDPKTWNCCHHRWINRVDAPSLLLIRSRNQR